MPAPGFATRHSGFLIQSDFGNVGNFELVVPLLGKIAHYWRDNDDPALPWHGPGTVGLETPQSYSTAALIQSNFHYRGGDHGDLEVVMVGENSFDYAWRENAPPFTWHGPVPILVDARDSDYGQPIQGYEPNPALIQSEYGNRGDFALIFPESNSGLLAHYLRRNDPAPARVWDDEPLIDIGAPLDGVCLLQRPVYPDLPGIAGNLVCVATRAGSFSYTEREIVGEQVLWLDPVITKAAIVGVGTPGMIQSDYGRSPGNEGGEGNFELVLPAAGGGLAHFWCVTDVGGGHHPWEGPTLFGQTEGVFTNVSIIQSNFIDGGHGNFEVVAFREHESTFYHYWRTNDSPQWNGPNVVDLLNP